MKTEDRIDEKKHGERMFLIAVLVFAALVSVGVFSFLHFYNSYIDKILYKERQKQMKEVTLQLFNGLEDVTTSWWTDADIFNRAFEMKKLTTVNELYDFMTEQAKTYLMDDDSRYLVAIDDSGNYLAHDGWNGTLSEMDFLTDMPEKASFVSSRLGSDDPSMFFLKKLSAPVTLKGEQGDVTLIYFGFSCKMAELNPYFECEAYDKKNSVYVLDEYGGRVFGSGDEKLLGYNAYKTLSEMEYLHGTSFESTQSDLEINGMAYSNAVLKNQEYYYALKKMRHANWTLLFLVPSAFVAQDVVSLVEITAKLILIFSVTLFVSAIIIIFFIIYGSQRHTLAIVKDKNELLSRINRALEQKNGELSIAIKAAQLATQSARAANKAKSEFLSNMSHDIRTPMNAIVGITCLMEHERGVSDKMRNYIRNIHTSAQHLLGLINDVLDMSKIEAGEIHIASEPVSLSEQLAQIDGIVRPQAEEKGQAFNIFLHDIYHEYLIGDGVRLKQILLNLLSNAVKYTPYGGDIRLDISELKSAAEGKAKFCVKVIDNGFGMSEELQKRVFEPFVRAENSTTNKVQGTGLGMTITKKLADLMGGKISIKSAPGKGTTVKLEMQLPINESVNNPIDFKSLLVVSDDEALTENLRSMVCEKNIELFSAKSTDDALKILGNNQIDVVLLAGYLSCGDLSGIIKKIREKCGQAPVFCTDYTQPDEVFDKITESGADGYIPRPLFLSRISTAVSDARKKYKSFDKITRSALSGLRFLCAEDNALNAEILAAMLEMYGATSVIYANGKEITEAFKTVKEGEFDAVLMDVQMPVMNGLEATRIIRQSENALGKSIPIIAMTANAFAEDVQTCLSAGMTAHLSKPIDMSALEKIIIGLNCTGIKKPPELLPLLPSA